MPTSDDRRLGTAQLLGVDVRGLAFLRIGLALCVLSDLATRAADLYAHYTDYGVLSRADVLRAFAWLHEWALSLHMASGSLESQAVIFLLHAVAALALLLGYRTRLATVVTWFLLGSVQLRNLFIGGGYDAVMRMLMLWCCFVPLGAYFALDNVRRKHPASPPRMVFSVGTLALLAQIAIIYWGAGYAKAAQRIWLEGTALLPILHDDFYATVLGRWIGSSPGLCSLLARAIVLIELAGPLLLIVSGWSAWLRTATVAALCLLNLGFAVALDVGLFPWVMSVGVLAFLPPSVWDRLASTPLTQRLQQRAASSAFWQWLLSRVTAAPRLATEVSAAKPRPAARIAASGVCAVVLAAVIHWNIGVAGDRAYSAPWYTNWIIAPLFLQQDWRMFADPSQRTGWVIMPARLKSDREIDLMAAGGRVPQLEDYSAYATVGSTRPRAPLRHYANIRWRSLFRNVLSSNTEPPAALLYGRYMCREWNRRHEGDNQLSTFQIVYVNAPLRPPYDNLSYTPEVVWTHDCFQ